MRLLLRIKVVISHMFKLDRIALFFYIFLEISEEIKCGSMLLHSAGFVSTKASGLTSPSLKPPC